jgi:hypothetical protein
MSHELQISFHIPLISILGGILTFVLTFSANRNDFEPGGPHSLSNVVEISEARVESLLQYESLIGTLVLIAPLLLAWISDVIQLFHHNKTFFSSHFRGCLQKKNDKNENGLELSNGLEILLAITGLIIGCTIEIALAWNTTSSSSQHYGYIAIASYCAGPCRCILVVGAILSSLSRLGIDNWSDRKIISIMGLYTLSQVVKPYYEFYRNKSGIGGTVCYGVMVASLSLAALVFIQSSVSCFSRCFLRKKSMVRPHLVDESDHDQSSRRRSKRGNVQSSAQVLPASTNVAPLAGNWQSNSVKALGFTNFGSISPLASAKRLNVNFKNDHRGDVQKEQRRYAEVDALWWLEFVCIVCITGLVLVNELCTRGDAVFLVNAYYMVMQLLWIFIQMQGDTYEEGDKGTATWNVRGRLVS